jgi:DNA primase
MDVVALAQHGVEYAVATLGTATTALHVQKLLRQSDEVVFCFDGDAAGRRAAWRALEVSLAELADGKQVRFLFLPDREDPDSYVRTHGREAFERLVESALPLSQFLLDELSTRADVNTAEGGAKLLQDAKPLVKQVNAPLLSLLLRKSLAERAGITQTELDGQFQIKSPPPSRTRAPTSPPRQTHSLTRKLIVRLMADPSLAQLADPQALAAAERVPELDRNELNALKFQLHALRSGEQVSSWAEYTRSNELGLVFSRLEEDLLSFESFRTEDVRAEFTEFWARLVGEIDKRLKLLELQGKSAVKI